MRSYGVTMEFDAVDEQDLVQDHCMLVRSNSESRNLGLAKPRWLPSRVQDHYYTLVMSSSESGNLGLSKPRWLRSRAGILFSQHHGHEF